MGGAVIGLCPACGNKAELLTFYPGQEPTCEDCFEQERKDKENAKQGNRSINESGSGQEPVREYQEPEQINREHRPDASNALSEKDRYLQTIFDKANVAWHKAFVRDVIKKRILEYDWKELLRSDRYFTLLDLKRYAMQLENREGSYVAGGAIEGRAIRRGKTGRRKRRSDAGKARGPRKSGDRSVRGKGRRPRKRNASLGSKDAGRPAELTQANTANGNSSKGAGIYKSSTT